MLQVSTLQGNIGLLEATVREEISQLAGSINSLKREAEEKNKLTFQLKTAIIVALISSATSIFIHFYSKSDVKDNVAQQQIIEKLDTLIKTKK
jgi:phosphomannomutase